VRFRFVYLQGFQMPPVDKPKSEPLVLLLDEIEILSAQTRLMELYLKRAHTAAFGEVERIHEQFRAKVTNLKARLENKETTITRHLSGLHTEQRQLVSQNQELLQRLAEQQNLIQHHQEESEQSGAEIAALRERLSGLEAAKPELENAAAPRGDAAHQELKSQIAQLQSELTLKEQALQQRDAAARQAEQSAQDKIRSLAEELANYRESAEDQRAEIMRAESERSELRQRIAQLESAREQIEAQAQRNHEALRQDGQAKIVALQSEIAHKTALLTRHQTTIAELERELGVSAEATRSDQANKQSLFENQAAEIARRDAQIAALSGRIAELEGLARQQQLDAADKLAQARENFAAELEALRAELREKQQLLEQGRGDLQHIEQELRNRNRELQGKLAAKEAVVESQEHNLRHVQGELLAARDALGEKERTLADWQNRVSKQEQNFLAQRHEWQCQLTEKQLLVESYRGEIERATGEIAAALERQGRELEERTALEERVRQLTAQVDALTAQLNETQGSLDHQSETLRQSEARLAELSAALGSARQALDEQQTRTYRAEEDFAARCAEFRDELERKEQALREHQAAVSRTEPALKAQIEELESRLNEKEFVLEARSREMGILQARVESLSGQTARLEAAHRQALADAASENDKMRQALQAEIAGMQSAGTEQQALLDQRQAALSAIEQKFSAQIDVLKEQRDRQQTLLDKQIAELRQAETEATTLRERIAQLESASAQLESAPALPSRTDADRVAALEQQLQSRDQRLAELEAALGRIEQEVQSPVGEPRSETAHGGAAEQSEQLRAAQDRIDELLGRLAELEADRHTLQENAGHELQQLRDSFESRMAKLRMELAAKEQAPAQGRSAEDDQTAITRLEEGFQRQIQELRGQLEEKHSLLENRNEELIKVKAEMDSLQDHLARLKTNRGPEVIDVPCSVELREEDAVEMPRGFVNGSASGPRLRPDPLHLCAAESEANLAGGVIGHAISSAERTNRFTHLEGRVRTWNPEPERESASGSGRRWNMGLFKRRWKV
jgi:chromosome segregation ATPase